ncbi:hypothetical protein VDGL01_11633 [Verticillium dahliae]
MPVQDKLGPPGVSPLSRNPGQGLTEPDLRASVVGSLACARRRPPAQRKPASGRNQVRCFVW